MATRTEHRVTFYSPGTFFSEDTTKPIPEWNPATAARMAKDITERHGAKPYGFRFSTVIVADPVPDGHGGAMEVVPKTTKSSGLYHLGGKLRTYDQVKAEANPKENILVQNMRSHSAIVCETANSWKHTANFAEEDVMVNPETGDIIERGDSPKRIAYRKKVWADYEAELANYR